MSSSVGATLSGRDGIDDGVPNPRGESLARLSIVFACLAGFFVILRMLARWFHGRIYGADDALIVVAMALAACMAVTYNGEAKNGFGLHKEEVGDAHKIIAMKWFFAAQILYKVTMCLTKLSLGALYLRIFPDRKFRIAVISVMAVTATYTLAAVLLTVFGCNPIRKSWNKELPGYCIPSINIWYSTSVLNIVTDVMIIVLPLWEIRRLQLPILKKLSLCVLFSLGSFVIACTIVRMVTVSPKTTASDQTYYQAVSNSWTFVETDVAIICACLPTLRVPISKQFRRWLGLSRKGGSSAYSNSNHRDYALGTIGSVSQGRQQSSHRDDEGDSVEDLIREGGGIQMTKTFGTVVETTRFS